MTAVRSAFAGALALPRLAGPMASAVTRVPPTPMTTGLATRIPCTGLR